MFTKKNIIIFSAICLLVGLALFGFKKWKTDSQFEFVEATTGPIMETVYGLGTIKSTSIFELKLGVSTSVEKIFVTEGDSVQRGQSIVKLSSMPLKNTPIEGVVTSINYHPGEIVPPNTVVMKVEDPRDLAVEVKLEQQGALRVKKDQNARLSFESVKGEFFQAKVQAVYSRNEEFVVSIIPEKLPENILPGMTCDVAIVVNQKEKATLIPAKSVQGGLVTIKRNGKRQKIKIEVGAMDPKWVEVVGGELQAGDLIQVRKR